MTRPHTPHWWRSSPRRRAQAKIDPREVPQGAQDMNVAGRRIAGPSQGFGQLWRKRYSMELPPTVSPQRVVAAWKEHFSEFWPGGSELIGGLREDDVAADELAMPAGTRITTGLVVVRSEETSFTLMTLQGHMFAGWVRFGADQADGATRVDVTIEMRAGDPIYEIGLIVGGHRTEDRFWEDTLRAVGRHFGEQVGVEMDATKVDSRRQWSRVFNTWHNAAIRTQAARALAAGRRMWMKVRA